MRFNIIGVLATSNSYVFSFNTGYVPRQYEEIEINGIVYVVEYVRYKLIEGSSSAQNVQLGLIRK
jgi:hypothetical protein